MEEDKESNVNNCLTISVNRSNIIEGLYKTFDQSNPLIQFICNEWFGVVSIFCVTTDEKTERYITEVLANLELLISGNPYDMCSSFIYCYNFRPKNRKELHEFIPETLLNADLIREVLFDLNNDRSTLCPHIKSIKCINSSRVVPIIRTFLSLSSSYDRISLGKCESKYPCEMGIGCDLSVCIHRVVLNQLNRGHLVNESQFLVSDDNVSTYIKNELSARTIRTIKVYKTPEELNRLYTENKDNFYKLRNNDLLMIYQKLLCYDSSGGDIIDVCKDIDHCIKVNNYSTMYRRSLMIEFYIRALDFTVYQW